MKLSEGFRKIDQFLFLIARRDFTGLTPKKRIISLMLNTIDPVTPNNIHTRIKRVKETVG